MFKHLSLLVAFCETYARTLEASQNSCTGGQTSPIDLSALCSLSTALDIALTGVLYTRI